MSILEYKVSLESYEWMRDRIGVNIIEKFEDGTLLVSVHKHDHWIIDALVKKGIR